MSNPAQTDLDPPSDPAPCYASSEEIALADRLRLKIEERYLRNDNGRGDVPQPFRNAA